MAGDGAGGVAGGGVRKSTRGHNMGLQWWRRLSLPRRGKKESLLSPVAALGEGQLLKLGERLEMLRKSLLAGRVTRAKHLCEVVWDGSRKMGRVDKAKGGILQSMGKFINGQQYLYPEEVLLLVDKGSCQLRLHGLVISVQHAWSLCLSELSMNEYLAYAHLRRAGYVVRRFTPPPPSRHAQHDLQQNLDCQAAQSLTITWSVWRCGSYKKRQGNDNKPLFYVAVYPFHLAQDHSFPTIEQLSEFTLQAFYNNPSTSVSGTVAGVSTSGRSMSMGIGVEDECDDDDDDDDGTGQNKKHKKKKKAGGAVVARSRTRLALIDRGMVVFVDVACNATPLSDRFVNRLDQVHRDRANELKRGRSSALGL